MMFKRAIIFLLLGMRMNAQDIKPGQVYRHYKGKLYKVVAVAVDTESKWIDEPTQITDAEKRVVYHGFGEGHALSTNIVWDRPYKMFAENVELDGVIKPRFELVNNATTLASYEKGVQEYIEKTPQQVSGIFKSLIDTTLQILPKNAKIIEIGSGFGRDAKYIESHDFIVERTDAVQSFVDVLKEQGFTAHNFNIVTDAFTKKYDLVYAAAVFLHLNRSEFKDVLIKIHEALNDTGILACSLKLGDGEEWESDKINGPRYFCYWRQEALFDMLKKNGFEVMQTCNDDKWIFVTARKR